MVVVAKSPIARIKKFADSRKWDAIPLLYSSKNTYNIDYLGEDTDRPIRQALMPKAGGCPPYLSRYPKGAVGFLVSGLGCVGGCDFCSTTSSKQ